MAVFWALFTSAHGPTSFNLDRVVLGGSMPFWGSLLGGPPNLLVGLGMVLLYPVLAKDASRTAKAGYALTLTGLIIPALADLFVWRALGPPFLVPIIGLGLILLANGNRQNELINRQFLNLLVLIGVLQLTAFVLFIIPLEISDQFGGYRIAGFFAYLLTGLGWVALGVSTRRNLWYPTQPSKAGQI